MLLPVTDRSREALPRAAQASRRSGGGPAAFASPEMTDTLESRLARERISNGATPGGYGHKEDAAQTADHMSLKGRLLVNSHGRPHLVKFSARKPLDSTPRASAKASYV